MKNNEKNSIVKIESEELKRLVAETKETVATNVYFKDKDHTHNFTVVDLWNIQKQKKLALRSKLTDRWGM